MEKTKKTTKRENFTAIRNILEELGKSDLVAVMEHELELLAKKNASGSDKLTATQVANNSIKDEILECMSAEPNKIFTITDMLKLFPCCEDLTNQKVSALVRQLIKEGKVVKHEDKRKSYFQIIV